MNIAGGSSAVPPTLTARGQLIGRDLPESVWEHPCFRARSRYAEVFACAPHAWCVETDMCVNCGVHKELALSVQSNTPGQ